MKSLMNLWAQFWAHMCGIDSILHIEDFKIWNNRPFSYLRLGDTYAGQIQIALHGHENLPSSPQIKPNQIKQNYQHYHSIKQDSMSHKIIFKASNAWSQIM